MFKPQFDVFFLSFFLFLSVAAEALVCTVCILTTFSNSYREQEDEHPQRRQA